MRNLLERALSLIPAVRFQWRTALAAEPDGLGVLQPSYGPWRPCRGMVQPVDAPAMRVHGLDGARSAVTVWASIPFRTLAENPVPDQILHDGRVYTCRSRTAWRPYNGWHSFLCVEDRRERSAPQALPHGDEPPVPAPEPAAPPAAAVW